MQISGHSRTIIGIEQRASGLTLLVLDPSHGPRQVAALGSSRDSLRLIRRNMAAMRAPQYQIVAVRGLFESEEQFQVRICYSSYSLHSFLVLFNFIIFFLGFPFKDKILDQKLIFSKGNI